MRSEDQVVITNPTGLHARPAVKLAQLAAGFNADVQVRIGEGGEWVRARSTARVMKLKAGAHSVLHFRADGEQAEDAVSALVEFVRRDFDEGPAATARTGTPRDMDPSDARRGQPLGVSTGLAGERTLTAAVASRGLAIGVLHTLEKAHRAIRPHGDAPAERDALDAAVKRSIQQLNQLAEGEGELAAELVEFQVRLLEDEEFLDPIWTAVGAGAPAETAWLRHLEREVADYETADSSYLRDRSTDLRDLQDRVTTALSGAARQRDVPANAVVVVDELTPSHFLELDWDRAAGIATLHGSTASHAAMLARSRGVPFLVRLGREGVELAPGTPVIIDAERGSLILDPSPRTLTAYERRVAERQERAAQALRHAARPALTRSGTPVKVLVNVDDPVVLGSVDPGHCDGVGLTRTEFLFHGRDQLPNEETQLRFYRRLLEWAGERPVTVRTLDAGGDKPVAGLTLDGERNPFLGLRGVRLSLARAEVFRIQLRALARAAMLGTLKVMVPMVTVPSELDTVRRMLTEEIAALCAGGVTAKMPPLGMMVEVPAAALSIESFDADFFSIGSNDLTSYLLAAARDSEATATLLDPLHPAVLELITRVTAHGRAVGKGVSVCGEMAAKPECLSALLEVGVRELSVPPAFLASTKAAVASI